jgi:RNA polymerase sigma factor (sigma-70 family)
MIVSNATEPRLFWSSQADRPIPRAIRLHGVRRLAPSLAIAAASPAVIFVDCEHADAASELGRLRADTGPDGYLIPVLPELRAQDVVSLVAHGANDAACHADLERPAPIIKRAKDQAQLMRLAREDGADLPRLLGFVDGMDSPVFLKDANGLYTGANHRFENFLGTGREGIQGKTVYDIAPSDLALTYHRADLELFARGGTQIYATGMRHATRGVRPVRLYKRTLHDPTGRIVGIVGTMHEIGDARGQRAVRAEFDALNRSGGLPVDSPLSTAPVTDPDGPLVSRIAAGEPSALARLYDLYRARLSRFVRRLSANDSLIEEIVNDTFLVVWNKAHEFRAECAVSTWLMAIAYRCALKALREQRHTLLEVELTHPDLVLEYWHDHETPDLLAKAFDVLSEDLRVATALAYLFGHSMEEIAQITGCPVTTVKARLHRARGKLRTRLAMLGEHGYA